MVSAKVASGISSEDAINQVTDAIWAKYDADNSGQLDKDETKVFVDGLANGVEVSAEAFDQIFKMFDEDGSGEVDKEEMVAFVKSLIA